MIICQICKKQFNAMITWRHLKKHGTTIKEYKVKYGEVVTEEYKLLKSKLNKGENNPNFGLKHKWSEEQKNKKRGKVAHNKGKKVTDPEILKRQRIGIERREEKYRSGELIRHKLIQTDEMKLHLSKKTTEYALLHPEEMKARAQKSLKTKKERGYDFGYSMRGKKHSEQTKQNSRIRMLSTTQAKTIRSQTDILAKIAQIKLTLLNAITEKTLQLQCNVCNTKFSFTKQYFHPAKFKESICPVCFPCIQKISKKELEVYNFVKTICSEAIQGYRTHYHDIEIDTYIPSMNLGFEFNGLHWHSEITLLANNQNPKKDFLKKQEFLRRGIRTIQIFEDEWDLKQDIVKSRILNILGHTTQKLYARKCTVKEINSKTASLFCEENHIMGKGRSNVRLGLFFEDNLVSVMTFVKTNLSRKSISWEVNRFCSLKDLSVVGGASKLFKKFIELINPDKVISYSDNRWSEGMLYKNLGFVKTSDGSPGYWYIKANYPSRIHRFSLRKNKNDDQTLTEFENRINQGYNRIWDCGSSKWEWSNPGTQSSSQ